MSLATLTPRVVNSKVFLDADAVQPRTPYLFQCEREDTADLEGFSEYSKQNYTSVIIVAMIPCLACDAFKASDLAQALQGLTVQHKIKIRLRGS